MKTKVLACETLRDEIELAAVQTQSDLEIGWVEADLHNFPDKLRNHLQYRLDNIVDCDRVLMAFGACRNSVVGIRTREMELVFPKVDDCISMLIGSVNKRETLGENCTYFITSGWLRRKINIWEVQKYIVSQYGEKAGSVITNRMLDQYQYLGLLINDHDDAASSMPVFHRISSDLNLEERVFQTSIQYLCDLLTGPWERDRFHVFPSQSIITAFPV